jgi:chaperonin GroES
MILTPIGERVILKPIKQEERTASGIFIPESDDKKKQGTIIAVGKDKNNNPLPLYQGDKVLYSAYSNEEFEIDNQKFIIVDFKDVIAKISIEGESNNAKTNNF